MSSLTRHRRAGLLAAGGVLAAATSLVLVAVLGGAAVAPAGPNPPGNNGVVKVDGEVFDTHPDNEPHVGCTFQVDFYGFDEGDLFADVTFEAHPPTGPRVVLLTDTVPIGEDDNSGGGSEAGLDAQRTYTLDLSGIEPHPNQGWHVKLTINADGSQGADVKYKVFWVSGCETPPTTTTTSTSTTSTTSTSTTSTSTTSTSTTSTTMKPTTTSTSTTSTTYTPSTSVP
jgi:hypothetical protein